MAFITEDYSAAVLPQEREAIRKGLLANGFPPAGVDEICDLAFHGVASALLQIELKCNAASGYGLQMNAKLLALQLLPVICDRVVQAALEEGKVAGVRITRTQPIEGLG